ncbi:NEDD8-conjugating enzyme UBE2F [Chionoecetes opilio]|uniref:NEDD8-conjugating enzyme UBE2F n=1 Tax=Chionoecetes opilio TaxID=41210 RepID=A0A8J5CX44_CHIOP|nr:NEDD8-conjugating enzyme UBE2F [Chionoecetes opilio]
MITLTKKLKSSKGGVTEEPPKKRISIRDQLLVKEVSEMESNLPEGCVAQFDDPDSLHCFRLVVTPPEGYWWGGVFVFKVNVPEEYNIALYGEDICVQTAGAVETLSTPRGTPTAPHPSSRLHAYIFAV